MKIFEGAKNKIIIGLLIIILILSGVVYAKISTKRTMNVFSSTIQQKVERLVELSTIKYNYTNVVEYENQLEFSGIDIPFTSKKFILKYSGYIKAGMDLSTVKINLIDRDNIEVTLEKAKIIETVIPEEDVYFFDERDSIFNKLSFKDLYVVLIQEKEKMKAEVIEKGILNEAEKNGAEIIESLLEGMEFKNINIIFK